MKITCCISKKGIIVIQRDMKYYADLNNKGHQFERLVTTKKIEFDQNFTTTQSLRQIHIGPHKVLISAEVDATDANGNLVEIKAATFNSIRNYRYPKTILQMVCNGSRNLVLIKKYKEKTQKSSGPELQELQTEKLESLSPEGVDFLKDLISKFSYIKETLDQVKQKVKDRRIQEGNGEYYYLYFLSNGTMAIRRANDKSTEALSEDLYEDNCW